MPLVSAGRAFSAMVPWSDAAYASLYLASFPMNPPGCKSGNSSPKNFSLLGLISHFPLTNLTKLIHLA
jgi:hypothetical protein